MFLVALFCTNMGVNSVPLVLHVCIYTLMIDTLMLMVSMCGINVCVCAFLRRRVVYTVRERRGLPGGYSQVCVCVCVCVCAFVCVCVCVCEL